MRCFSFVFLLLALCSSLECAKILGILPLPGKSHYQAGSTLMKILAARGHDVTVVSPFGEKNPPKNYRDVILTDVLEKFEKTRNNMFMMSTSPLLPPFLLTFLGGSLVEELFNNTNFQNLMKTGEKFDVVIMEHFNVEPVKYVAYHLNAPLIVYNALESNYWINPYQGNPANPAYTPSVPLEYTCDMTFFQRLKNTLIYTYNEIVRSLFTIPYQNRILHKYYPDAPSLSEISNNVSLVLVNTDPSIHEPLPRVPSIIGIGGFHIQPPKPLPKDIEDILDNAKNGVIYFSMGSNLKINDMPKEKRDIIMNTFAKFKETVIWKFEEEELPGKPDNVIIKKWLPQNDIFAHKNIKLFITHGGIFSTMEAIYHGIPILAIPIFGDQTSNAKRATNSGYARWLEFPTMTEEQFESAIRDMLTNPAYAKNIKRRSAIMRDKPISPQDAVNYWVEYVIRHKGADHLRVASLNLSWYQTLLLDVIAFAVLVLLILVLSFICCFKLLLRLFKRKDQLKLKKH